MGAEAALTRALRRRRMVRLLAGALALGVVLTLAQKLFPTPSAALPPPAGPSVYINTYVPGQSFANTVLYYGARHSTEAARATTYAEVRAPAEIVAQIRHTAEQAGRPLDRITIAGHGKPGGVMLDRHAEERPEDEWLLASHTLLDWYESDLASAVSPDAIVVFESCDTSPIVQGAPAAEAEAFRSALAATFGIPREHVILFRGPAKYAWGLDGWVPRTYPLEIVFADADEREPAA